MILEFIPIDLSTEKTLEKIPYNALYVAYNSKYCGKRQFFHKLNIWRRKASSSRHDYARTSYDSNYIEPRLKHTVNSNREQQITEQEVFRILDTLKKTATGLDKLPAWFLRLGAPVFAKRVASLFNKSLQEGAVPDQWRRAYIHPIAKTSTPAAPVDYRPISITPVLSRILEKLVVRNFIYPTLPTAPRPLSFSDQYAFRPTGSTTAALVALLHKITTLLLTNPFVVVIVLDYSKAFDMVKHATLMEKFSLLGIPDHIYNWIVDYFSSHEHCTIFNGALSTFLEINSSVFQGSSLGPASYAVNASDLRPCTEGNDIVKFADDFDLIIPATNLDSRNAELQHIEDWSIVNNLKLNRNKSQEIVFYRPYSHQRPLVPELLGIPRVTSIKILGVVLMNNLSMEEHLSSVIASSAKALYALRILRSHGMKNEDLMTVYQATVISRLQYASPAWWGYTTVSQRERLENFLRKSIKSGFYSTLSPSFTSICDGADSRFLAGVVSNDLQILHCLLPPLADNHYDLRERRHPFRLPDKKNSLFQRNFFIRIFYSWWSCWIFGPLPTIQFNVYLVSTFR